MTDLFETWILDAETTFTFDEWCAERAERERLAAVSKEHVAKLLANPQLTAIAAAAVLGSVYLRKRR